MLNILLIADIVSKTISLVIFVCLAIWSIRNLKVHYVSCASEHKRDVRLRRTDNSAVAEHAWDNQHQPDWDGVQCLSKERHWYTRRVKEAINIRLNPNNFNRYNGIDIPEFWMRTIRRHDTRRPASQHRSIPFSRRSEPAAR